MSALRKNNLFVNFLLKEYKTWHSQENALYWRTAVHAGALAHHASLCAFAPAILKPDDLDERFRVYKSFTPLLLTLWNLAFQLTYLWMSLRLDMAEWRGTDTAAWVVQVRSWRDTVFCALVVPFSVFVSISFWILYIIDRNQIFPEELDSFVPTWLNHALHTNIVLIVILEMIVQERPPPASHTANLKICLFFSVLYSVCLGSVYLGSGLWLYPVFEALSVSQLCILHLFGWLSLLGFYHAQWLLVDLLHGRSHFKQNTSLTAEQNS